MFCCFQNKVHGRGVDLIWIKYEIFIVVALIFHFVCKLCICVFLVCLISFYLCACVSVVFSSLVFCSFPVFVFRWLRESVGSSAVVVVVVIVICTQMSILCYYYYFMGDYFYFFAKGFMHFTFGWHFHST